MTKLGFIGGGNMAEALARGLIARKIFKPSDILVSDVDSARRRKLARSLKVETTADNLVVLRDSTALLIAVKPQNIDDVLGEMAAAMGPPEAPGNDGRRSSRTKSKPAPKRLRPADRLFISIAAGITIERMTGKETPLPDIAEQWPAVDRTKSPNARA